MVDDSDVGTDDFSVSLCVVSVFCSHWGNFFYWLFMYCYDIFLLDFLEISYLSNNDGRIKIFEMQFIDVKYFVNEKENQITSELYFICLFLNVREKFFFCDHRCLIFVSTAASFSLK